MAPGTAERLRDIARKVESGLIETLEKPSGIPHSLKEAMAHPLLAGGKRLRPALLLEAGTLVGGLEEDLLPAALAVEMIHTYSLVHDDLPSMDDDDLRRGKPTVHRVFGEAMAILVGDALQTLAFETLCRSKAPRQRLCEAMGLLARAAGPGGMVGGQVLDLEAEGAEPSLERVRSIHRLKTGALLGACPEIGAVLGGATERQRDALRAYGRSLGLAFQIVDDCLDETATAGELGKSPGKDRSSGKMTWPACVGLGESRAEAHRLAREAEGSLRVFKTVDLEGSILQDLSSFVVDRGL